MQAAIYSSMKESSLSLTVHRCPSTFYLHVFVFFSGDSFCLCATMFIFCGYYYAVDEGPCRREGAWCVVPICRSACCAEEVDVVRPPPQVCVVLITVMRILVHPPCAPFHTNPSLPATQNSLPYFFFVHQLNLQDFFLLMSQFLTNTHYNELCCKNLTCVLQLTLHLAWQK